jgi:hypothetical protein
VQVLKAVSAFGFFLAVASPLFAALVIDGRTDAANNRYANDPSFIAGDILSGLGRSIDNSNGKWGTLVSANVFIGAFHWSPQVGDTLTFYASNDPAGPTATRTVIGARRMGTSDIWVGVLDSSLPADYQPLAFYQDPIASEAEFDASPLAGAEVFMIGRWENTPSLLANVAVGRNKLDRWYPAGGLGGNEGPIFLALQDLPSDNDYFVEHEAAVDSYDSGGPVIVDLGGIPTVIGLNWYKYVDIPVSWRKGKPVSRNGSGFSVVGDHADGIQGVIDGFAIDATAGYIDWMSGAFGGSTDWSLTGPAVDFDQDGWLNLTEYAFCQDPLSGAFNQPPGADPVHLGGAVYSAMAFCVREDPHLRYDVLLGNTLQGWSPVPLLFNGAAWSSSNPAMVTVHQQADLGGGIWSIQVRGTLPLDSSQPLFLAIDAVPLPY